PWPFESACWLALKSLYWDGQRAAFGYRSLLRSAWGLRRRLEYWLRIELASRSASASQCESRLLSTCLLGFPWPSESACWWALKSLYSSALQSAFVFRSLLRSAWGSRRRLVYWLRIALASRSESASQCESRLLSTCLLGLPWPSESACRLALKSLY